MRVRVFTVYVHCAAPTLDDLPVERELWEALANGAAAAALSNVLHCGVIITLPEPVEEGEG